MGARVQIASPALFEMAKRTGPANPHLRELIAMLKKQASVAQAKIWKRVAYELERPSRQRRIVNLYKIDRFADKNETVVVPGKVLGIGELTKNVCVAAFAFSRNAAQKINKVGKTMMIGELLKTNPKGRGVRLLG